METSESNKDLMATGNAEGYMGRRKSAQTMEKSEIISIYKEKGDPLECGDY